MMLECSNLNVPSKAAKFQKPSVKEITPSSSHKTTFTASEKARDWRDIKGLDEVFTAPRPRKYLQYTLKNLHNIGLRVLRILNFKVLDHYCT